MWWFFEVRLLEPHVVAVVCSTSAGLYTSVVTSTGNTGLCSWRIADESTSNGLPQSAVSDNIGCWMAACCVEICCHDGTIAICLFVGHEVWTAFWKIIIMTLAKVQNSTLTSGMILHYSRTRFGLILCENETTFTVSNICLPLGSTTLTGTYCCCPGWLSIGGCICNWGCWTTVTCFAGDPPIPW